MYDRFHQCLRKIVACIVIVAGEILLTDMVENIVDPGNHLVLRYRVGIFRIQDRKLWHHIISEYMSDLLFLLVICYNSTAVHFRTCSHHRKYAAYRNDTIVYILHPQIILIPRIFLTPGGNRNSFRIINRRTSAYRKDQIHIVFLCDPASLIQLLHGGIGHDARIFKNLFPRIFKGFYYFIIDSVFLNRTSAIGQHDSFSIILQFFSQKGDCVISEVQSGRI